MRSLVLWACLILSGCATSAMSREDVRARLVATDTAFSDLSIKEGDARAFAAFAAPDAIMFGTEGEPKQGIAAIRAALGAGDDGTLSWQPLGSEVAAAGDLGYTWGTYVFKPRQSAQVYTGHYVSIWKLQSDGTWKWVVDIGTKSQ